MIVGKIDKKKCGRLGALLGRARRNLESIGVVAVPPHALDPLEDAMGSALPHIHPTDTFRQALAENLSLVAHGQKAGLEIERPRHLREGIILGVSAGLIAAAIAGLILLLHSRAPGNEQASD